MFGLFKINNIFFMAAQWQISTAATNLATAVYVDPGLTTKTDVMTRYLNAYLSTTGIIAAYSSLLKTDAEALKTTSDTIVSADASIASQILA